MKGLGEGSFFGFIGLKRKEAHKGTVKEKREKLNVRMIIIVIGRLKLLLYLEFKNKNVQFHEIPYGGTEAAPFSFSPVYPYN